MCVSVYVYGWEVSFWGGGTVRHRHTTGHTCIKYNKEIWPPTPRLAPPQHTWMDAGVLQPRPSLPRPPPPALASLASGRFRVR